MFQSTGIHPCNTTYPIYLLLAYLLTCTRTHDTAPHVSEQGPASTIAPHERSRHRNTESAWTTIQGWDATGSATAIEGTEATAQAASGPIVWLATQRSAALRTSLHCSEVLCARSTCSVSPGAADGREGPSPRPSLSRGMAVERGAEHKERCAACAVSAGDPRWPRDNALCLCVWARAPGRGRLAAGPAEQSACVYVFPMRTWCVGVQAVSAVLEWAVQSDAMAG